MHPQTATLHSAELYSSSRQSCATATNFAIAAARTGPAYGHRCTIRGDDSGSLGRLVLLGRRRRASVTLHSLSSYAMPLLACATLLAGHLLALSLLALLFLVPLVKL